MEALQKNIKIINKIGWFFIIAGCIEAVFFIIFFNSFFGIIPGLITIIFAYFMTYNKGLGFFVGSWAIFKYNPAILGFILQDFFRKPDRSGQIYDTETSTILFSIASTFFLMIAIASLIIGIITIVKTAKYFKLKKTIPDTE